MKAVSAEWEALIDEILKKRIIIEDHEMSDMPFFFRKKQLDKRESESGWIRYLAFGRMTPLPPNLTKFNWSDTLDVYLSIHRLTFTKYQFITETSNTPRDDSEFIDKILPNGLKKLYPFFPVLTSLTLSNPKFLEYRKALKDYLSDPACNLTCLYLIKGIFSLTDFVDFRGLLFIEDAVIKLDDLRGKAVKSQVIIFHRCQVPISDDLFLRCFSMYTKKNFPNLTHLIITHTAFYQGPFNLFKLPKSLTLLNNTFQHPRLFQQAEYADQYDFLRFDGVLLKTFVPPISGITLFVIDVHLHGDTTSLAVDHYYTCDFKLVTNGYFIKIVFNPSKRLWKREFLQVSVNVCTEPYPNNFYQGSISVVFEATSDPVIDHLHFFSNQSSFDTYKFQDKATPYAITQDLRKTYLKYDTKSMDETPERLSALRHAVCTEEEMVETYPLAFDKLGKLYNIYEF